ncbi:outer membrane protein assembly factor BamA [Rhodoligotrophos defluvii]|uniref:outer membrane protein assembly factor BamA n=1 Tax=Rhodoligotrophos defluvii TaxID=2561934 RepID=UPI0010C9E065|nr:outer membrane protein assembly factor BamA [Rhodoligotrophos defluvii]
MRYRFVIAACLALLLTALGPIAGIGFTAGEAHAQTVSRIAVEGNQRIDPETVTAYMQIGPGDPFDAERIDQSLKALFQTGLFSDVQIFRRGNVLVVHVEENPLINQISFEGNSEITDENLGKEVELKPRMVFTRARVQSDVQRLQALYRRSGLFAARIEPKVIRLPQNRVNLVFEITEGATTRIQRITFIGNEAFDSGQLRDVITTEESRWWKFLSTSDNYDPDRLAYDRELLRRFYLNHGYADFQVLSATAELAPDGENFYITFTVYEGPQYNFGPVAVDPGSTNLSPEELMERVRTRSGDVYSAELVDSTVERLTVEAGTSGYAFAKVRPRIERDEQTRTIGLTYTLEEGPRVYIERIDIVGNTRTQDNVIRREIRLVEGDAYNRVLVDRARRRITALDFFSKVDIIEQPGSAPDRVVLIVQVEEKSTGTLNFAAGYSTSEAVVGSVSVTERNLLGKGQFVRLATSLSFKRQEVDFSFTEPYFLGRNLSAGIDAYATRTDQQDESSFDVRQLGGGFRFGFPLSENGRITTRYNFTNRRIWNVPENASQAILQSKGTTNISLVGATYVYDMLDNPLNPTSGYRFQLSTDVAGLGGDAQWARAELAGYYFYPIWDGVVFMARGTAGHMEPLGKEIQPIDRFFKGGNSFRGFERAGIGPRDISTSRDDALGGYTYGIGTLEVTFPLGLPEEFGIRGAVFTDFGTLFNAPDNFKCSNDYTKCLVGDKAEFRASAGASVIWQSPFGPLRFDFAEALLKEKYDKTEWFRFSVGTQF